MFGEENDPFGFADRWHSIFPDATSWVVDGGNHFPMCDDPHGLRHACPRLAREHGCDGLTANRVTYQRVSVAGVLVDLGRVRRFDVSPTVRIDDTDPVSYIWSMPRATPSDRLPKLLDAAASAFVEHGFQRTQMDDIAERLGVSKGTIYRAVDSKESLFAAVIAWSDNSDDIPATGIDGSTDVARVAAGVAADLATAVVTLELTSIVAKRSALGATGSFGDEVERITTALYQLMQNKRTAVMVLDRCANEIPELAAVWFGDGRYALVDLWHDYLELRSDQVTGNMDRSILARTIVEIVTIWAVKMPWDPAPRPYPADTSTACASMIRSLVTGAPQ